MNKYALVTGAGTGIGQAVSIGLLQHGYDVALTGRHKNTLMETADLSGVLPSRFLIIPADITDPVSVADLFNTIKSSWGRLDLLFNNAGTNTKGLLEDISYESWRSVIDTNLTGAFLCTQQAFQNMKAQSPQGGRIINKG